jgi:diguanylate cyclase (GGDEF)-like protein
MESHAQEPLPSVIKGGEHTIRVLAAGNDALKRSVALALDTADVALVDATTTSEAVMDKLADGSVDCVVIDKNVGTRSSFELFEQIGRKHRSPPAMVLLTEDTSAKTLLKAFRMGFSDCVACDKDYANELRQAIRRGVERTSKLRQLNEEIDYLAKLARSDRLTGLPSRAFLEDRVANLAASGDRHGNPFAVFLIDVDNFRQINDIYGHAVGDQALKAFGRRLMLTSRASDAFGRFGGDEFLYLIDRAVSPETVALVCDRLVGALQFSMDLEAVGLSLSASIGAAIFPSDGSTREALLVAAERALHAAKSQSRRYCLASEASGSLAEVFSRPKEAGNGVAAQPKNKAEKAGNGPFADAEPRVIMAETPVGTRGENRRVEHRNRVFKRGRIIFGDGFSTMDCVVRDLSLHGARLSVEDQVTLPQRFSFAIVETGTTYPAIRRWQHGKSIGIEFWVEDAVTPQPLETAPATEARP